MANKGHCSSRELGSNWSDSPTYWRYNTEFLLHTVIRHGYFNIALWLVENFQLNLQIYSGEYYSGIKGGIPILIEPGLLFRESDKVQHRSQNALDLCMNASEDPEAFDLAILLVVCYGIDPFAFPRIMHKIPNSERAKDDSSLQHYSCLFAQQNILHQIRPREDDNEIFKRCQKAVRNLLEKHKEKWFSHAKRASAVSLALGKCTTLDQMAEIIQVQQDVLVSQTPRHKIDRALLDDRYTYPQNVKNKVKAANKEENEFMRSLCIAEKVIKVCQCREIDVIKRPATNG